MIDVIIPTYKPGTELWALIDILKKQTVAVNKVIIMNTEEEHFKKLLTAHPYELTKDKIEVHHISKAEFDHGRTRNAGVNNSQADIFVMMTQDAMPTDDCFIERLTAPFLNEKVASSFARQLAGENSSLVEKVTRQFNYPEGDYIKSVEDTERMGIKTYFCSNVACAYRREVFDKLGGFVDHTIFNEDMIYAAAVIKAGYLIAYASTATVYHSHNYTASQQFHRNVDIGVSQADHPEVFEGLSSESEGKKMVIETMKRLWKANQGYRILPYVYMTGCKYLGYLVGKNYKKLPKGLIKKCSMNPAYFE